MKKKLSFLSIPVLALAALFLFEPATHANHETTIQQCAESFNNRKDNDSMSNEENRMLFEMCRDRVKSQKKGR